jgi:hypothetical protein
MMNKIMNTTTKKSHPREWWYMFLTVFGPIAIGATYFGTWIFYCSHRDVAWSKQIMNVLEPTLVWSPWILMPVLTNIAFGPSLLAFTVCKKESRFLILIVNLIVIGLTAVIYMDNEPERYQGAVWPAWTEWLPFVAIPLLCLWVKFGKAAEATGNSRSGVKMVLAHICAIAAMFACLNYKSPERQVAEQLLDRMTIKWTHDGKTEYFHTYSVDIDRPVLPNWHAGVKYEGAPAPRSTEGYSYASWVQNTEGDYYDLVYSNRGVGFWFNDQYRSGVKMHWEYISYKQLFESEEFELIKSKNFWPTRPPTETGLK